MTKNDGKEVERLVQLIEGAQLPKDFTVETRRHIFDGDGTLIAELDIVITGKIGSATIQFLIECRDRPSEGAAPRSWIEQLIGRRQSLGLNKVMAVSSTGFSLGAKKLAEEAYIELRHLQDLKYEDVAHWLPIMAPLMIRRGVFNSVRLGMKIEYVLGPGQQNQFNVDEKRFRHRESHELVSLAQVWQRVVNDEETWRGVPEDGSPQAAKIAVKPEVLRDYTFVRDGNDLEIGYIEFDASLVSAPSQMPLVQAASYLSQPANDGEQESYLELGRWVGSDEDLIKELIIMGFPKKLTT